MEKVHDLTNKHKRCVFLDDIRLPKDCFGYTHNPIYLIDEWIIVRNYDEFIKDTLENGIADIYSFDHDLADGHYAVGDLGITVDYDTFTEKTGYHCAKWLIEYCIDNHKEIPLAVFIHSMNPAGSKNIESLFTTYEKLYRTT